MLIKKDKDIIQSYLEDYSNIKSGNAEGVALPENEAELISFLSDSYCKKIPITLSGGGTGTTGGRVPYGGYVLSTERLNKIIDIGENSITLRSGVMYEDMEKQIDMHGLFLPPNPTETTSFIGGNAATGASGSRSYRYGSIRKYVSRLRIILCDGDVLDLRRGQFSADKRDVFETVLCSGRKLSFKRPMYRMPDVKNAAGYYTKPGMDLIDLFIGSEGTLGVIGEIELKLLPALKNVCAFFVFLDNDGNVFRVMEDIERSGLDPIAIEYYDRNSLCLLGGQYKKLPEGAEAGVYIEKDIKEDSDLDVWMRMFESHGISDSRIWFGQTKSDLNYFHEIRHAVPDKINEIVKKQKHIKFNSDIAVPRKKLKEMMAYYKKLFMESGLRYFIFGHIGEAHLHTNLLPESEREAETARLIYEEIMKKAVSLGGTITAEHGVGKIKHHYLEMMYGENGIGEMARVKKVLDPLCLLNRGNIIPEKYM